MSRTTTFMCLLVIVSVISGGCQIQGPTDETRARLAALPYPDEAAYAENLDIRVVRERSNIRVVNREPLEFEEIQIWLNREYVRLVDRLEIGTGNSFALNEFVNVYRESYPAGTFLQPELGQPVYLAEVYDPRAKVRYRLVRQPDPKP